MPVELWIKAYSLQGITLIFGKAKSKHSMITTVDLTHQKKVLSLYGSANGGFTHRHNRF